MRSTSKPFRTSVYDAIKNVTYLGELIPVASEYANSTPAILNIGNNKQAKAWIQLTNQTSDDNSPKCHRNDLNSIQIQVRVAYNANSGSYEHAENIADLILEILFPIGNEFEMPIESPFHVWNMSKESERNINYQDSTDRIWMKNILITAQIEQSA
jgi:hypothetical protein